MARRLTMSSVGITDRSSAAGFSWAPKAVSIESVDQRSPRDPQPLRRLRLIACTSLECLRNPLPLVVAIAAVGPIFVQGPSERSNLDRAVKHQRSQDHVA